MNELDWLSKAIDKKYYIPAMRYIYRDKDKLIATNGHRLHFVRADNIAEPHLIGTTDKLEYPDCENAIPKSTADKTYSITGVNKTTYQALKLVVKASEFHSKRAPASILTLGKDDKDIPFFGLSTSDTKELQASYKTHNYITDKVADTIHINPSYFIDALADNTAFDVLIRNDSPLVQINHSVGTAIIARLREV